MNIFNYVFYKMCKSTAKVNDLSPEIATIIFLSVIMFLNVFSVLLLCNISIENIGRNKIFLLLTLILVFNFYYFLNNGRYKTILHEYDTQTKNKIWDGLIFLYPFISFYVTFKLLKMNNSTIYLTLSALLLVEVYAYFNPKNR